MRKKTKRSASTITGFQGEIFFSGNVSFARLSNSVLVGCFKFQRSMGCKTSSFLLSTVPASSFDFLFSFALRRCSFLLTRGRVHKNSNIFVTKKCEWTSGRVDCGREEMLALLLCSVHAVPLAYQMWRLRETILTDARQNTKYTELPFKVTTQ